MRMMISGVAVAAALMAGSVPALATAPTSSPDRSVTELNSCGYDVAGTLVNLRSGPGAQHASLGHLHRADLVIVDRKTRGWYRVTTGGRSRSGVPGGTAGWVAERYLQPSVCMQLDCRVGRLPASGHHPEYRTLRITLPASWRQRLDRGPA
ncbi:SH3 domain-containing protein [Streptomyces sp. NPDC002057]|uniref:SH3 domain-containing protein n=1 Tax=Streptomyces sp. NPDC002057 TaxID=3154664 RepID=UPI00331CF058